MAYQCTRRNKECDGCMDCKPEPHYYCPVCGEEALEAVFVDNGGTVLGCDNCAQIKEPYEVLQDEADKWELL